MDADFTVELGRDDPVLDFPWTDPSGRLAYVDLKQHSELLSQIAEAEKHPELAEFLRTVNSVRSAFISAKCDVWATEELTAEEQIFGASFKFASYVDLVFSVPANRNSFSFHENLAKRLVALLRRAPEISSSVEACVRRCFFQDESAKSDGFYFTLYVSGYGENEAAARKHWAIGLTLVANAIMQLSGQATQRTEL
jgi:hypothetical protein